ncbi:MAG TPA: molecular chaperone TorD family protein [Usitatibacteraceae bacterium]|nr:molecular chaperone TorD family protein [Usitatibacteraceae bacterium]
MLNELLLDDRPDPVPARAQVAPSAEDLRHECIARAGVYRLIAGVFVEEPGVEFLATLRSRPALEALAEAGVRFESDFLDPDPATLAEALAVEYTTMFAASGGFPPVESIRLTGRYQQAPHFDVKETYRRAGFVLSKGHFQVLEDHLGVELLFVAELLDRAVAALDRGDLAGYRAVDRDIKRFWTLHLARWVRGYCHLVERASEHSLFREMARFLAGFATEEIESMRLRVDDLDQGREVVPKSEVQVAFNPDEPVCGACGNGDEPTLPRGAIPIAIRPAAA